jgi:hypothetical protein
MFNTNEFNLRKHSFETNTNQAQKRLFLSILYVFAGDSSIEIYTHGVLN